jgi:hypothetical protein
MDPARYRLIAWLLAWMYLALSVAGEGLHRLPGMGHTMQCGRVALWLGGGSSNGGSTPALSVHCSVCPCPGPSRFIEDQESSADPISVGSVQPDTCCPICSFLAMGKWFTATQERIWVACLVAIATAWRMDRPDTKAHWGMLARGPPRNAGMNF